MINKSKAIFNVSNDGHKTGIYPLFLGQQPGLYDSINVAFPVIFEHYKQQMQARWTEDEFNFEQSRMDLLPIKSKPEEIDLMVKTLSLLWELDSVASRSVIALFAPFITNSELGTLMTEWSAMENIHALTYSEIIRQCISDPNQAFKEVLENDEVLGRSDIIIEVFRELELAGAKYKLDMIKDGPELKKIILKGIMALYLLERVQFMSSFAIIFGMAETNRYIEIASAVQLICRDELLHAKFSEDILNFLRKDDDWNDVYVETLPEFKELFDEVMTRELKWNEYLFSEGRTMVGLNKVLLDDWVYYCAGDLAERTDIPYDHKEVRTPPFGWIVNWIEMNRRQNANQELSNNNYSKNAVKNDLSDDELFDI